MAALVHTIAVVDQSGKVVNTVCATLHAGPCVTYYNDANSFGRVNISSMYSKKPKVHTVRERQKLSLVDKWNWNRKGFAV